MFPTSLRPPTARHGRRPLAIWAMACTGTLGVALAAHASDTSTTTAASMPTAATTATAATAATAATTATTTHATPEPDPALAAARDLPLFVSASSVAPHLDGGDWTVLDVRPVGDFLAGHVPGAVHLDDEALRGPAGGLPVQFHDLDRTRSVLAAAGVQPTAPVLVYSDGDDPLAATMVAWRLHRAGHPAAHVLDGGWAAWAANHPTTRDYGPLTSESAESAESAEPTAASHLAWPSAPTDAHVTLETLRPEIGWDTFTFVDARPAAAHRGDVAAWPRSGHIPGAFNLDWTTLVDPANRHRLRPTHELRQIVLDAGIERDADVIVYCGTGREATLLALVLDRVLELPSVRLYEGSWTEYAAHPDLPVEIGPRRTPMVRIHADPEGRILISAQPDVATLRRMSERGVVTVVNCRSQREVNERSPYDLGAVEADLGVRMVHIPLGWDDGYDPSAVAHLDRVLASSDGPVLIHCASGGRARTLWQAWLMRHGGLTADEARARVAAVGGGPSSIERLLGERLSSERTGTPLDPSAEDS